MIFFFSFTQFLHKDEYLKGIEIYESIIKAYASFNDHVRDGASKDELWVLNDHARDKLRANGAAPTNLVHTFCLFSIHVTMQRKNKLRIDWVDSDTWH